MDHVKLIVKNGVVRIPSIFMFESYEELTVFLNRARESTCIVIFENEEIVVDEKRDNFEWRTKLLIYSNIIGNREIVNAYLRYLGDIDKMSWDNARVE